jgi:hypothetical protein
VGSRGFWTACLQECQIVFNTGINEKPTTIVIEGFIQGAGSEIAVSGAFSSFNTSVWDPIASIPASTSWFSTSIDLADFDETFVFNINLIPGIGGFILIDKIIFDDGLTVSVPTFAPIASTLAPEWPDYVALDKENDNAKYWKEAICTYALNYEDFDNAWGCPTPVLGVPAITEPSQGFWSSCGKVSCDMIYYDFIMPAPLSLKLHTYIKGSGEIHVLGKRSPFDDDPESDRHLYTISVGADNSLGYCNHIDDLDFVGTEDIHVVTVRAVSATGGSGDGFVLVDRLSINISPGFEDKFESSISGDIACDVYNVPQPSVPTGSPTTTTTTTTTTRPPNPNAGVLNKSNAVLLALVLIFLNMR